MPETGSCWQRIKHVSGMDRAIAFTLTARGVQMLGSTGTVLLIVRFLTPAEQGYYYTLLSLVALQVLFELGFAFVVLQLAAHESARLSIAPDGCISGDAMAHARLASVLQKAVRWYAFVGLIMALTLLPLGTHFFASHSQQGIAVHWRMPWVTTVTICVLTFLLNPVFSFLEGCGQVPQVARMRMWQSVTGTGLAWSAMILHHGLFSPAMVLLGNAAVGLLFIRRRRTLLGPLLRYPAGANSIAWNREVWPFQWRIAFTWMGTYFTAQVFMPILFVYRGPVEAGRMGLSLSITGYLGALVLSWMHTKAAPFGQLVAQRKYPQLDRLFFCTLKQSGTILLGGIAGFLAVVLALQYLYPRLAHRMLSPPLFALLLATGFSNYLVQSEAIYLRAFKREPFLVLSLIVGSLTVSSALLLVQRWGVAGVSFGYFVSSGIVGLIIATTIFRKWRMGQVARSGAASCQHDWPGEPAIAQQPTLARSSESAL
ncbi:MAG: hypothetical protein ABSD98_10760 [Candidatus Korobacteraceae bacterium]